MKLVKLEELEEQSTVSVGGYGAFGEMCTYKEVDHELLVEAAIKETLTLIGPRNAKRIKEYWGIK